MVAAVKKAFTEDQKPTMRTLSSKVEQTTGYGGVCSITGETEIVYECQQSMLAHLVSVIELTDAANIEITDKEFYASEEQAAEAEQAAVKLAAMNANAKIVSTFGALGLKYKGVLSMAIQPTTTSTRTPERRSFYKARSMQPEMSAMIPLASPGAGNASSEVERDTAPASELILAAGEYTVSAGVELVALCEQAPSM